MIITSYDTNHVLNKVNGRVTIKELLDFAQSNVDKWVSDPVLWDLSNATMIEDKSDYLAIKSTVGNIHKLVEKRKGRKTAFVAPEPLAYGMLRMAITIVDCTEERLVASVFTDIKRAKAWLIESSQSMHLT
jgi:hypothetical protein